MKRTGIKRKTALAPGGPLARKGSRPGRGAPIKPVNRKRKREAYARNFGPEADAVRAMPCLCESALRREFWAMTKLSELAEAGKRWSRCTGHVEAAHVDARGMGGCNGDGRFGLVPLCRGHHEEAGEVRTSQRAAFEVRYGLDLRREADRIAVGHAPPLGIRWLALRWAAELAIASFEDQATDEQVELVRSAGVMSLADRDALMGWVGREIERSSSRVRDGLEALPLTAAERDDIATSEAALAEHIGLALGMTAGLASELCKAARERWPS